MTDPPSQPWTSADLLEQARAFVLDVLAGAITPETHRWAFDEDTVLFSVRRVEYDDPAWLLAQLADRRHPFDGRAAVLAATRDVWEEGLAVLREEQPDYLR
jgi:hypothetical protein